MRIEQVEGIGGKDSFYKEIRFFMTLPVLFSLSISGKNTRTFLRIYASICISTTGTKIIRLFFY